MPQCPECGSTDWSHHNPRGQASKSNMSYKCNDCDATFGI